MRTLVHQVLTAALAAAPVAGRVYPTGTLGVGNIPATPDYPYVQYAFGTSNTYGVAKDTADPQQIPLRVYVYDEPGSYVQIDDIVRLVRDTIVGMVGEVSPSGRQCTGVAVNTIGDDVVDSVLKRASKVITFRLTAQI